MLYIVKNSLNRLMRLPWALPRCSKDFGQVYFLNTIIDHIGILTLLKNVFPDDYQNLISMAFFEISQPVRFENSSKQGVKTMPRRLSDLQNILNNSFQHFITVFNHASFLCFKSERHFNKLKDFTGWLRDKATGTSK